MANPENEAAAFSCSPGLHLWVRFPLCRGHPGPGASNQTRSRTNSLLRQRRQTRENRYRLFHLVGRDASD